MRKRKKRKGRQGRRQEVSERRRRRRKEARRRGGAEEEKMGTWQRADFMIYDYQTPQTPPLPPHLVPRASPPPLPVQIVSFVNTPSPRRLTTLLRPLQRWRSFASQMFCFPGRFVYSGPSAAQSARRDGRQA